MTVKWTEVSAYSGQPVDEDAPTNFAGAGSSVDMNPTGMPIGVKKRKKRALIDARTKGYREHKAKLETARLKRLESRKSKMVEKVKESIADFNRESLLAEDNVAVLKNIVKSKSAKPLKFSDGSMKVDLTTASIMMQVLGKVNKDNQAKLTRMINGKKGQFMAAASAVMKMVNK
jgi:hypothetical protein|tara:strand:- start:184 stop:705 length:522 start_codon:yes stop_codon:yes gene_type:complete